LYSNFGYKKSPDGLFLVGVEGFEPPTLPAFGPGRSERLFWDMPISIYHFPYSLTRFPSLYFKFPLIGLGFGGKFFSVNDLPVLCFRGVALVMGQMFSQPFFDILSGMADIVPVKA